MADGLAGWRSYWNHVQGGLPDAQYISAEHSVLCSAPPYLGQTGVDGGGGAGALAFPIGLAQGFQNGQSQAIMRLYEIGSRRAYAFTGRSVGQFSLSRPLFHGPSILRVLMAYYDNLADASSPFQIESLFGNGGGGGINPFSPDGAGGRKAGLKAIHIPPGYGNHFGNLASDLFSQPFGFLTIMKDNSLNTYSAQFFEACLVPTLSMGYDSNGMLVQESVSVQYERMHPVRMQTLDTIDTYNTPDEPDDFPVNRGSVV